VSVVKLQFEYRLSSALCSSSRTSVLLRVSLQNRALGIEKGAAHELKPSPFPFQYMGSVFHSDSDIPSVSRPFRLAYMHFIPQAYLGPPSDPDRKLVLDIGMGYNTYTACRLYPVRPSARELVLTLRHYATAICYLHLHCEPAPWQLAPTSCCYTLHTLMLCHDPLMLHTAATHHSHLCCAGDWHQCRAPTCYMLLLHTTRCCYML
jgi:hypothetical protein